MLTMLIVTMWLNFTLTGQLKHIKLDITLLKKHLTLKNKQTQWMTTSSHMLIGKLVWLTTLKHTTTTILTNILKLKSVMQTTSHCCHLKATLMKTLVCLLKVLLITWKSFTVMKFNLFLNTTISITTSDGITTMTI